jgi:hypothetical protein
MAHPSSQARLAPRSQARLALLVLVAVGAIVIAARSCGAGDPPSIARLGTVGITKVDPARVVGPGGRRPARLMVRAALNTVYPTRDADHASEYRRFHWVQFSLSGAAAPARLVTGQNDDRSHSGDGSYQPASTWIDQYLAVFAPAPRLPARGRAQLLITACDRDPRRAPTTFCQQRSLPLCVTRGVLTGEPTAPSDGQPNPDPRVNSCQTPGFWGQVQSAADDGLFFRSLDG